MLVHCALCIAMCYPTPVHGRSVTVQRHRHSGNLKVLATNRPTYQLTGIGAGDAYASKKN